MASRQEEKQRRRQERLAAEQAAASAASRSRRIQLALGALITVGVVVGIVIALGSSGGSGGGGDSAKAASSISGTAPIPKAKNDDLASAAKAAGCVLKSPAIEGFSHVTTPVRYKTNPPTSGNHNPDPALDGVYDPGTEPEPEHYVHTLEHGRVEIQYGKGSTKHQISQLTTLYNEPLSGLNGYKTLLFQNNTNMPYAVAATSWGQMLGCPTFNDKVFDAVRDFRAKYVDKGREIFPPNNT
jgi:hypothetical protein